MNLPYSCAKVALQAISDENRWDIHPYRDPAAPLFQSAESIASTGLLYLPLLRKSNEDKYECITGNRCLTLARSLTPFRSVLCRLLEPAVTTSQLLALIWAEHTTHRALLEIELAHFIRLCRSHLDSAGQESLFAAVGIPAQSRYLGRLLELLTLENEAQNGLMEGRITESFARELLRLTAEDRAAFLSLVNLLNLGGGKQKRLLSLLRDLAGRMAVPLADYVEREEIQTILSHHEMNIPQKGQVLLQLLQDHHSPSLAAVEKSFASWHQKLDLPGSCSVRHSPAFEQDAVSLSVTFPGPQHLQVFLEKVRRYLPE